MNLGSSTSPLVYNRLVLGHHIDTPRVPVTLSTTSAETMRLSARGYHRVLRVARTLADLDGAEKIGRLHLAEALSYRALAEDLRRAA
jgi:predicted ATPase with chaperone activity